MLNIITNIFKKLFFSYIKKTLKRFEKNTSLEAEKWIKSNIIKSTDEFVIQSILCYFKKLNQK